MRTQWKKLTKHEIDLWVELLQEQLEINYCPHNLARSIWTEHRKQDLLSVYVEPVKKIKHNNSTKTIKEDYTKKYQEEFA